MEIKTLHDQHVHTLYSVDSEALIEDYLNVAIKKGCSYFVMTDHLDYDLPSYDFDWIADYQKQKEEIALLNKKYQGKINILQGIEFGYKRNRVKDIKEVISSVNFDVINMSIHDYADIDFYFKDAFERLGVNSVISMYLDLYYEALCSGIDFDVLSHIDYAYKTALQVQPDLKFSVHEAKLKVIFEKLISMNKTFEINTKVQETINNKEHARYLLSLYYSLGGRDITISSDSHTIDRYLSSFDEYKLLAKQVGFDHLCYFIQRKKHYYKI